MVQGLISTSIKNHTNFKETHNLIQTYLKKLHELFIIYVHVYINIDY